MLCTQFMLIFKEIRSSRKKSLLSVGATTANPDIHSPFEGKILMKIPVLMKQ